MKMTTPIAIAAILTACGAAATSADNSADASQSARRGGDQQRKQQRELDAYLKEAADMESAVQNGGIPGCFDPSLTGRERAVAERLGGVPCSETSQGAAALASGGDNWSGRYRGGGEYAGGDLNIRRADATRYYLRFEIGAPGCGGEIDGIGHATANRMTISVSVPDSDQQCRIMLDRQGSTLRVNEGGACSYFHGAQCSFNGSYVRGRSASAAPRTRTVSAPQVRPAARSASWIVGSWVIAGGDCGGDIGITYFPDGAFATHMDSGRWQLAGNTLTHTTLETYTAGDSSSRRRVANPQPSQSQILARTPSSFVHRSANGAVRLEKCQ